MTYSLNQQSEAYVGTMIKAPWDDATVAALNRFQQLGAFHPFTCPKDEHDPAQLDLVATADGWTCPDEDCDYTQDWAIAVMVKIAQR